MVQALSMQGFPFKNRIAFCSLLFLNEIAPSMLSTLATCFLSP